MRAFTVYGVVCVYSENKKSKKAPLVIRQIKHTERGGAEEGRSSPVRIGLHCVCFVAVRKAVDSGYSSYGLCATESK
jgi:hypothetical protein